MAVRGGVLGRRSRVERGERLARQPRERERPDRAWRSDPSISEAASVEISAAIVAARSRRSLAPGIGREPAQEHGLRRQRRIGTGAERSALFATRIRRRPAPRRAGLPRRPSSRPQGRVEDVEHRVRALRLRAGALDADRLDDDRRSSRRPAVSTSVTGTPPTSSSASSVSRVVPGTSVTIARSQPDERVEERRLAGVWAAEDRDAAAVMQEPPRARGRREPVELGDRRLRGACRAARGRSPPRRLRKNRSRPSRRRRRGEQVLAHGPDARAQARRPDAGPRRGPPPACSPRSGRGRPPRGRGRSCPSAKCPLGELARPRRPRAAGDRARRAAARPRPGCRASRPRPRPRPSAKTRPEGRSRRPRRSPRRRLARAASEAAARRAAGVGSPGARAARMRCGVGSREPHDRERRAAGRRREGRRSCRGTKMAGDL